MKNIGNLIVLFVCGVLFVQAARFIARAAIRILTVLFMAGVVVIIADEIQKLFGGAK